MSDLSERGKTMSDSGHDSASPKAVSIAEREALRAALAKATPGPWYASAIERTDSDGAPAPDEWLVCIGPDTPKESVYLADLGNDVKGKEDAHAIALAVNLAPALLEALDGAEATIARQAAGIDASCSASAAWRCTASISRSAASVRAQLTAKTAAADLTDLTDLRARLASAETTALESSARLVAAGEQAIRDGAEIERLRAVGLDAIEVRSFVVRGSRVHAHAPGLHGDGSGKWRVHYCPTLKEYPALFAYTDTFAEAVEKARALAAIYADTDRRALAGDF